MKYRVMKPIPADDGSVIPSGEIVEADGWRNVRQLVNGRYLAPLVEVPVDAVVVEVPVDAADVVVPVEEPKARVKKPSKG